MSGIISSTDNAVDAGGAVRAVAQAEMYDILGKIRPSDMSTAELVSMVTLLRPVHTRVQSGGQSLGAVLKLVPRPHPNTGLG